MQQPTRFYLRFPLLLGLFLALGMSTLRAQSPTQTIRGQVRDADNGEALIGANVRLLHLDQILGAQTDSLGQFRIAGVPVGHRSLQISYVGYTTVAYPELLIEAGRELVLEVQMAPEATTFETLVLYAPSYSPSALAPVSQQTITVQEARRFPATFNDPARLAMSYPGVVSSNDQANNMVIRGNSPALMAWHLEGVEIVNPNHLTTAGTANDRPTANGGGVNILSAQLLGASTFLSGAFPANYGNSLAGVMDMRLRSGNSEQYEFTGQVGLIGIDVAGEGPLVKGSDASFLVNYRYSTLGVLSALGVDLGDETINFQDLSFNLNLPTAKAGRFRFFGMGGLSSNQFEAPRDTALWEFQKDQFDIRYESRMGLLGATHRLALGNTGIWRSTLAYSAQESTRTGIFYTPDFEGRLLENDTLRQRRLALHTVWNSRPAPWWRWQVGLRLTQQAPTVFSDNPNSARLNGSSMGWLWQPYASTRLFWSATNLELNAGLHFTQYTFNGSNALEPRLALSWKKARQEWTLAYGLHSKLQLPQLYFLESRPANRDLELSKAHHLVLAHQWLAGSDTRLKTELYYQQLFDVPEIVEGDAVYSAINLIEAFITPRGDFSNTGTGRNYGLEITWQHFISRNYYYLLNASLYESEYRANGQWLNTRFNGNYLINLTGGKEFVKQKKGRQRTLGVNLRLSYRGGFWETPIDLEASRQLGRTVFDQSRAFSEKLPDVFKVDFRLYFRKDKAGSSSTWALDLQNATGQENLAFRYYDTFRQEVVDQLQLGLIPNLSWRKAF
ncbi:MAG: TonB-dependent receptor [Bacteroidota bacterium]